MSTIEDFENAPIGATATHKTTGSRAMKTNKDGWRWVTPRGGYLDGEEMERLDYTLDPATPTTAFEALALAWDLAHEVKPGQVIPRGTRFLEVTGIGLGERIGRFDLKIDSSHVKTIRTLEPLPEPLPEWLDAPAVLAECLSCNEDGLVKSVHVNFIGERWACTECQRTLPWRDLTDVTPLYPKEGQDS